eukprot:6210048-Prymnesium_polylepis.1
MAIGLPWYGEWCAIKAVFERYAAGGSAVPLARSSPKCDWSRNCEDVTGNGHGTWDNDREHAWTQIRAALRPRARVHSKARRV